MGDILPTFATIFASSTANTVSFFGYLFPIIPLTFAVVVVVAAIGLVRRLIHWLGEKIGGHKNPLSNEQYAAYNRGKDPYDKSTW